MTELSSDLVEIQRMVALTPSVEIIKNLFSKLSKLTNTTSKISTENTILKSLYYQTLRIRHDRIPSAYAKTFDWIFEDRLYKADGVAVNISFKTWLASQNGIYWISGKPGSGKSSLMKYISHHNLTESMLDQWAGNQRFAVGSYYCWNAGSEMQKSQEGLLRSLLYDVLRKCPDLIPIVCPDRWQATRQISVEDTR
jgi:hypothetical protein